MQKLLRTIVWQADRSRLAKLAFVALAALIPSLLVFPARRAVLSLAGLLTVMLAQRKIWVALVPASPLRCAIGTVGFALVTAAATTIVFHGKVVLSAPSCATHQDLFETAWAALLGVHIAAGYASGVLAAGLEGAGNWPWSVARPAPYVLIRAALLPSAVRAVRASAHVMTLMAMLCFTPARHAVFACGFGITGHLSACSGSEDATLGDSASAIPSPLYFAGLLVRGASCHACVCLVVHAVPIMYTERLDFDAAAKVSSPRPSSPTASAPQRLQALEDSLSAAAPLTQHLGFDDLATLAEHCPLRRRGVFQAERGAMWPRALAKMLRLLDDLSAGLERRVSADRKQREKHEEQRKKGAASAPSRLPLLQPAAAAWCVATLTAFGAYPDPWGSTSAAASAALLAVMWGAFVGEPPRVPRSTLLVCLFSGSN